jgi:uncharacterized protein (DUF305 family)
MQMSKGGSWISLAAAACLLAGCGSSKKEEASPEQAVHIVQPGAPGKASREITPEQAKEADTIKPIAQDVGFMRDMIHHHRQAILMTGWVPQRTQSRDVELMAQRMASSQESEIEQSERWLGDRGFDAGHDHGAAAGSTMPGMLSRAQLDRLKAAKGRAFDRLFLRYMTIHHQGALTMARTLVDEGGGAETEIGNFVRHVEADQQIEIERMRQVLARLH